jgi:Reverse transcriptase (RNA-dependent DNA polymerase)
MPLRAVDFSTPIEMLTCTISFKIPPKKFVCVCFVHNTSLSTSKLDVKSYKFVFVGYSSGKKRYKCYDPAKKRMFESLDVTFREMEPYFVLSNAQSNASPVTFQDTLEVLVTLPSDPVSREGEHRISNNGTENTMVVSLNTRSSTSLDSNADQNLPPPTRQIHKVYTRKPRHENVEQLPVQDQYQLLVPVDDSPTSQPPGNLELPSCTNILSDPDLVCKGVRSAVLEQKEGASTSHPISHYVSFETLPSAYKAFVTSLHSNSTPCEWRKAMQDLEWKKSMFEEMRALVKNDTWDIVSRPSEKNIVGCKWVYSVKYSPEGNVDIFKARLVAKGYTQTYGVDYEETFAPVAKMNIVRTLISCAVNFG